MRITVSDKDPYALLAAALSVAVSITALSLVRLRR
jgi:hypothetical protein